jgi:hypothetical protein
MRTRAERAVHADSPVGVGVGTSRARTFTDRQAVKFIFVLVPDWTAVSNL